MELRPEEISRIIRSQIKHYEAKINQSETGTVILIGDGIAKAAGLTGCMVNELLEFPGGVYGMAQNAFVLSFPTGSSTAACRAT